MIEINLLPGIRRKSGGRGAARFDAGALFGGATSRVRDPWLLAAIAGVAIAVGGVAWLHTSQAAKASELAAQEQRAQQDSARFTLVITQRQRSTAERDSVLRQLEIIRGIDGNRYVWAHVLDEISHALPAFTWLTTVEQASPPPMPIASTTHKDTAKAPLTGAAATRAAADSAAAAGPMKLRIAGQTVDIQALTLFMKQLESSQFIQNVQLSRSDIVVVDGKDVTGFQLEAEWQTPDPLAIRTIPLSVVVR
jgi:Tfp pilus assembly protein PilN